MKFLTKKIFYLIITAIIYIPQIYCMGNKPEYAVKNIPGNLLKDADAIVRKEIIQFTVKNEYRAVEKVTKAFTILNSKNRDLSVLLLYYNKNREIEDIEGAIYDTNGIMVKELEKKDIKDYSAVESSSLHDDSRAKVIELYYERFPYTVEFTYEISYDGYINWPSWISQSSLDAVEYSHFEIVLPENQDLRYWCNREDLNPSIKKRGSNNIYSWEAKNLEKLSEDVYGNDYEDYASVVYTAPSIFEIEDSRGDMSSWESIGRWYYSLIKGKDFLPKEAIDEVNSLVSSFESEIEKVKRLYKYMQERTRYISIQLGLGKWEPFDATFVHKRGYGDCKALCNYMSAILKAVGIEAYPVLIRSGNYNYKFIEEFPNQMFNHVILCVPLIKDTVWLECTSSAIGFGVIGSGNENRKALMIKPEGGIVINTSKSMALQNLQLRKGIITIKNIGSTDISAELNWLGNQASSVNEFLSNAQHNEIESWITKTIRAANLKVNDYKFDVNSTGKYDVALKFQMTVPRYTNVSNNRIFFQPNVLAKRIFVPADVSNRYSPIKFSYPYCDIDSLRFMLPGDYTLEALPSEVDISTSFGKFLSKTILENENVLLFVRHLEIFDYYIPPENYSSYRKFMQDIAAADRASVVLLKNK